MTKTIGYLFPDPIDPEELECFKIYVPKDVLYLAAFWSSYEYLTTWHAWKRDDDHTALDVAAVWRLAYEQARTEYLEGGGCMPEFRINGETCLVEVKCGDDWQPVYTPGYDPGKDGPHETLYPGGVPEGQTVECTSAANVVAMLTNGATNFSNLLSLNTILGDVVAFLYTFLASVVTVTLSQLWLGLGVQYGAFNADTFPDDLAVFDWEVVLCLLNEHYETDGTMTGENWALVLEQMNTYADEPNQIWLLLAMVWGLMGRAGAEMATRWGNITEADCSGCNPCVGETTTERDYSFATSDDGFYAVQNGGSLLPMGVYTSGAWHTSYYPGPDNAVAIVRDLTRNTLITRLKLFGELTGGYPNRNMTILAHRIVEDDYIELAQISEFTTPYLDYGTNSVEWSGCMLTDKIKFICSFSQGAGGDAQWLTAYECDYIGSDPF